ncbi:putative Inorganic phosphate cotransporter, partial [Daphnia magna]
TFVGHLTHGNQTLGQWQISFFTTAAVFVFEFVVYTVFASGEEQPWIHVVVDQKPALKKRAAKEVHHKSESEQLEGKAENP